MAAAPKAGEFQLKIEPADKIVFVVKKPGEEPSNAEIKITNTTKQRQAVKVKCTSNDMFRIRPAVLAIKPDETSPVQVVFNSKTVPDNGKHYFVLYHIKAADEKTAARQLWTDHKGDPEGSKRLTVDFDNKADKGGDTTPKKADDKKDETKKTEEKKAEAVKEEKVEVKKEETKDGKKEEKKVEKKEEVKTDEKKADDKKKEKKEEKKEEEPKKDDDGDDKDGDGDDEDKEDDE